LKSFFKHPILAILIASLLGFVLLTDLVDQTDQQVHSWINKLSPSEVKKAPILLTFPPQLTDLEKKIRLNNALEQFILAPPQILVLAGDWSHDTPSWVSPRNAKSSMDKVLLDNLSTLSETTKIIAPLYPYQPLSAQQHFISKSSQTLTINTEQKNWLTSAINFLVPVPQLTSSYSWLKKDWQELLFQHLPLNSNYPITLMYQQNQQLYPSLALGVFLAQLSPQESQPTTQLSFKQNQLRIAGVDNALSLNATFWSRIAPAQIVQKSLTLIEQQPSSLWADKVVYIAPSNDKDLAKSVVVESALNSMAWDSRPSANLFFVFTAILIMALFHIFLSGKLSHTVNFLITTLIVLMLLIAQITLAITQHWWFSGVSILFWVLILHLVLMLQTYCIKWVEQFGHAHDDALQLLAIAYQEKGELNTAFGYLKRCHNSAYTCDLLYQLAQQMERKRDYEGAVLVYQRLQTLGSKQYKNLEGRITKLQHAISPQVSKHNELVETLAMPKPGIQLPQIGRYRIQKIIGQGAMGVVYLGQDPKIGRSVAIKTLNLSSEFAGHDLDDAKQRFYREAETAGQLRHPNIVTIYDVGEEQELAYIAMDFLKGKPLNEFTKPEHLLSVNLVYQIIQQVAEALEYAHQKGIVHRDIKPANIIFNEDSQEVVVTDFGIACVTDNSKTRTGTILGSPYYMSPEQLEGSRVDGRADIYSLGVTFFQLLTGKLPFEGDSLVALTHQIAHKKPLQIRDIREDLPPSASRIINKTLQKKPEQRFQTAKELAETLSMALHRI